MEALLNYVETGFPLCKDDLPKTIQDYFKIKENINASDGVVLYKDRVVIPASLRADVLSLSHSAH